jgi:SAM-dependent methyltransferase
MSTSNGDWGAADRYLPELLTEEHMDSTTAFKEQQRAAWANFALFENLTASSAPRLVAFAGVRAGAAVLDVGCGTGVVGLTAGRLGAHVSGSDLTPQLIERARENSKIMGLRDAEWHVADVEALPFADAQFDFVLSQFGHMFAPRPTIAAREMLRVLKPGGTIAFSTWPPELMTGRMFQLLGKYSPPLPEGVSPPVQWGDPQTIRDRLGDAVRDITFARDAMFVQTPSVAHFRLFLETTLGPAIKLVAQLQQSAPAKVVELRRELEALAATYFMDNHVRQDYLLTRAVKR